MSILEKNPKTYYKMCGRINCDSHKELGTKEIPKMKGLNDIRKCPNCESNLRSTDYRCPICAYCRFPEKRKTIFAFL